MTMASSKQDNNSGPVIMWGNHDLGFSKSEFETLWKLIKLGFGRELWDKFLRNFVVSLILLTNHLVPQIGRRSTISSLKSLCTHNLLCAMDTGRFLYAATMSEQERKKFFPDSQII